MPELPPLPPIASQPLSVVLLAHDAAGHLADVLSAWVTYLNGLDRDYQLIVADDGSTDGTGDLAEKLAASYRRVTVCRSADRRGEGAALRAGLALAEHPLLFYTLCDPHYQPADLGRLLRKRPDPHRPDLEIDHVHILSAARGGRPVPAAWRALGGVWRAACRVLFTQAPAPLPGWLGWKRHLGSLLARGLFGVRYHDPGCPFRLLRRDILRRIPLQSDGAFVHVELLAKANSLGLVMGEEVALEPGHYPPPEELSGDALRQWRADARRVLLHPDFGPAEVGGVEGASKTPAPEGSDPRERAQG